MERGREIGRGNHTGQHLDGAHRVGLTDARDELELLELELPDSRTTDLLESNPLTAPFSFDGDALELDRGSLEADVELAMRDTRVIIAMFAEMKAWLQRFEKILTVKDVTGSGSIVLQGQHLYLRNLEIEGRKLRGRAELDLGEEKRKGILYVRFHGIAIGLERDGDEKDWKLTGVKKWFDRRVTESW